MSLKYTDDKYLDFLQDQDNDKLEVLVKLLMYDTDGEKRKLEELSSTKEYIRYEPNHKKYWNLIAADYKKFAGNTVINFFRGSGISYEEILHDVCDKLKIKYEKNIQVADLELNLLLKAVENLFESMTKNDRETFLKDLDIEATDLTDQAVMIALKTALNNKNGYFIYHLSAFAANIIAFQVLGKMTMPFIVGPAMIAYMTNPVGWVIGSLLSSGPAYRVTIPMTIYIAALRQAELNKNNFEICCPHCNAVITNREINICENCGEEYR